MRKWIVSYKLGEPETNAFHRIGIFNARSAGAAIAQAMQGAFRDVDSEGLTVRAHLQELAA